MDRIPASITASLCLAATATLATPQLLANSTIQSRIVGGSDIDISQAPATVALVSDEALASTGSFFQSQFYGDHSATESANATSLTHTIELFGESRGLVMGAVSGIWQSESACNIIRIGAGKSRRAFFLETCAFANVSGATLCQATPDWVEYRFLENMLVQVAFDFDTLKDQQRYDTCISQQASTQDDSTTTNLLTNQSARTTVSDANAIDELHWMSKSSKNTQQ